MVFSRNVVDILKKKKNREETSINFNVTEREFRGLVIVSQNG